MRWHPCTDPADSEVGTNVFYGTFVSPGVQFWIALSICLMIGPAKCMLKCINTDNVAFDSSKHGTRAQQGGQEQWVANGELLRSRYIALSLAIHPASLTLCLA